MRDGNRHLPEIQTFLASPEYPPIPVRAWINPNPWSVARMQPLFRIDAKRRGEVTDTNPAPSKRPKATPHPWHVKNDPFVFTAPTPLPFFTEFKFDPQPQPQSNRKKS